MIFPPLFLSVGGSERQTSGPHNTNNNNAPIGAVASGPVSNEVTKFELSIISNTLTNVLEASLSDDVSDIYIFFMPNIKILLDGIFNIFVFVLRSLLKFVFFYKFRDDFQGDLVVGYLSWISE